MLEVSEALRRGSAVVHRSGRGGCRRGQARRAVGPARRRGWQRRAVGAPSGTARMSRSSPPPRAPRRPARRATVPSAPRTAEAGVVQPFVSPVQSSARGGRRHRAGRGRHRASQWQRPKRAFVNRTRCGLGCGDVNVPCTLRMPERSSQTCRRSRAPQTLAT